MIWEQEDLLALSEEELRTQFLIPLFQAMGFQDVRHYHGGPLERGKDVVMWKTEPFRGRVYYAAVVKAGPITGSVDRSINTIVAQVSQCFGSPIKDSLTGEVHNIDQCLVVTSHEMKKESIEALRSALLGDVGLRVTTVDGPELWRLWVEKLPARAVLGAFRTGHKVLEEMSTAHEFHVGVGPSYVRIEGHAVNPDAEPVELQWEPKYLDTEEGKRVKEAYQRHLATGAGFTAKAGYFKIRGLPEALAGLFGDEAIVEVEPRQSLTPLVVSVASRDKDGQETVLIPYVELRIVQVGEEELILENDLQPVPFRIQLQYRREQRGGRVNYHWDFEGYGCLHYLKAMEFIARAYEDGRLVVRDYLDGTRLADMELDIREKPPMDFGMLKLIRRVVELSSYFDVPIRVPSRDYPTAADLQAIVALESVATTGSLTLGSITTTLDDIDPRVLLAAGEDSSLGRAEIRLSNHVIHVFDSPVPLGPVQITCPAIQVHPEDREVLKSAGDRISGQGLSVRLIPVGEAKFEAVFEKWAGAKRNAACE